MPELTQILDEIRQRGWIAPQPEGAEVADFYVAEEPNQYELLAIATYLLAECRKHSAVA